MWPNFAIQTKKLENFSIEWYRNLHKRKIPIVPNTLHTLAMNMYGIEIFQLPKYETVKNNEEITNRFISYKTHTPQNFTVINNQSQFTQKPQIASLILSGDWELFTSLWTSSLLDNSWKMVVKSRAAQLVLPKTEMSKLQLTSPL